MKSVSLEIYHRGTKRHHLIHFVTDDDVQTLDEAISRIGKEYDLSGVDVEGGFLRTGPTAQTVGVHRGRLDQ
jgi:uncharacterized protein YaaQ